jgi:hypothetical protein
MSDPFFGRRTPLPGPRSGRVRTRVFRVGASALMYQIEGIYGCTVQTSVCALRPAAVYRRPRAPAYMARALHGMWTMCEPIANPSYIHTPPSHAIVCSQPNTVHTPYTYQRSCRGPSRRLRNRTHHLLPHRRDCSRVALQKSSQVPHPPQQLLRYRSCENRRRSSSAASRTRHRMLYPKARQVKARR